MNQELEIIRARNRMRAAAKEASIADSISVWWTVNGYADILDEMRYRLQAHQERAVRTYGVRVPSWRSFFEEGQAPSVLEELLGPLCRHCGKPRTNCDCDGPWEPTH